MQILIAFVPLIFLLIVMKIFKVKNNKFVDLFLLGFLSIIFTFIFNGIITLVLGNTDDWVMLGGLLAFLYYLFFAGLSEELAKFVSIKISRPKTKSQLLVNAMFVGCFFGIIENYAYLSMDLGIKSIIYRMADMHILFQIIMAYIMLIGFNKKGLKWLFSIIALIVTIAIHGCWDHFNEMSEWFFIIGFIVCYAMIIVTTWYASKLQKEEEVLVTKKGAWFIIKTIILVLLVILWLFLYNNSGVRKGLNEPCEYKPIEITVLSAKKVKEESLIGEKINYIKVHVKIKNNSSEEHGIETLPQGFQLVNTFDSKEYETPSIAIGDLDYIVPGNGEIEGYIYFETDKDISTYKLVYSEYNSEYKDENRKCNFSLK